jgi:hypothetical protein
MRVLSLLSRSVLVAFVLLFCIVQCKQEEGSHDVPAERMADTAGPNVDSGAEPWLISFHDDAETAHFDGVTKWLETRKCAITETVNESYIKFLVANMTKSDVKELESEKDSWRIEAIEEDDLVWDSMDKSEL